MNKSPNEPLIARVTAQHKGAYSVRLGGKEYSAKITGKQIYHASSKEDYPAVGDWVKVEILDSEQATILEILPRKSVIKRTSKGRQGEQIIASNIDAALIIESLDRDYSLNRIERYFSIVSNGGIEPVIVLNKTDLVDEQELKLKVDQIKKRFEVVELRAISTKTLFGLNDLKNRLAADMTYCLLGSSGVGKSSLINKLIGEDKIATNEISGRSGRGKHTTTNRQMYFLRNGAVVIDNPGIREVGVGDAAEGLSGSFDEISELATRCKFNDCSHIHEPGCAVLAALGSGELDNGKYNNFLNLKKEANFSKMSALEKRQKDRKFGKFLKKAKEQMTKYD